MLIIQRNIEKNWITKRSERLKDMRDQEIWEIKRSERDLRDKDIRVIRHHRELKSVILGLVMQSVRQTYGWTKE